MLAEHSLQNLYIYHLVIDYENLRELILRWHLKRYVFELNHFRYILVFIARVESSNIELICGLITHYVRFCIEAAWRHHANHLVKHAF